MTRLNESNKKPVSNMNSVLCTLLLLVFTAQLNAANNKWETGKIKDSATGKSACTLFTPKIEINDGYGDSSIQLFLYRNRLEIKTGSNIDGSRKDVGIQVDLNPLIPVEQVKLETIGVFKNSLPVILKQFKAGGNVQVKMRFWPSWPETAVVPASFSLVGFTAAYNGCWNK